MKVKIQSVPVFPSPLLGELITACKCLYRQRIPGTNRLFSLDEKGTARIKAWKLKPDKYKQETRHYF